MVARAAKNARNRSSLRRRLTGGLALVVFVAAVVGGIVIIGFVHETEASQWATRQQEAALTAARVIQDFMKWERDYLHLVARLDPAYLRENPRLMADLLAQNPDLIDLARIDDQGRVVAGAGGGGQSFLSDQSAIVQSAWFSEARQGQDYAGEVQISAEGLPYIILAGPTPGGGAVAARLKMLVLQQAVVGIHLGKTGQTYIVDEHGHVVAHPDQQIVLSGQSIAGRPEMAGLTPAGEAWQGRYNSLQGASVVGAAMPIGGSDWTILAEISVAEARSASRRVLWLTAVFCIAIGTGTTLLNTYLIGGLVLRPLDRLRRGAMHIGRGDLAVRLSETGPDEFGQVADTFNWMAARLQEREALLAQTRDEAVAASQFKSRLLRNVSHDLRTPLSMIVGYAEALSEGYFGPISSDQKEAGGKIAASGRRLSQMIESLLDEAQIEAGRIKLNSAVFHPADLIRELEITLGFLAERKGLELLTHVDPGLPAALVGDPQRLQQILMNLVDNAIKFTDEGRVCVRLYGNHATWAMEVLDTGCGIPPEAHGYIFDPFRQVPGAPGGERSGIGLGLSIVRQLVTLMGGDIHMTSAMARGTTFVVTLPLEREATGADEAA